MTFLRVHSLVPFLCSLCACATAGGTFAPLGAEHPASAEAPEVPITDPSAILRAPEAAPLEVLAAPARVESDHGQGAHGNYVCPMHPDVASDSPGNCPRCGMKLVPRPAEPKGEEHPHER